MKVIHYSLDDLIEIEPIAIALGYFDGIHLGHQALMQETMNYANSHHIKSAVMTFNPNPLITIGKMQEERYLTSLDDRTKILEELGIDYFIIVNFTKEVSQLSDQQFYERILKKFDIRYYVCGFDFHFGYKGVGSGETLKQMADCEVYIQEKVADSNLKVSSTRINEQLRLGNIEEVNRLFTRPYRIYGKVIKGRQIGRTIGFPTANVEYKPYVIPSGGVYVVKVEIKGKYYVGMCNIGYNPTFDALDTQSLEVNIFDFNEDIYDEYIYVYFYHKIRPEQKFASVNLLIEQLTKDTKTAKEYFKA